MSRRHRDAPHAAIESGTAMKPVSTASRAGAMDIRTSGRVGRQVCGFGTMPSAVSGLVVCCGRSIVWFMRSGCGVFFKQLFDRTIDISLTSDRAAEQTNCCE